MSTDLMAVEERVRTLETQMKSTAIARERLFQKLNEELAGAHVFVRDPVEGWKNVWLPHEAENALADLAGVARLHSELVLKWVEATAERDRIVSRLPAAARSTILGLRLIDGGSS